MLAMTHTVSVLNVWGFRMQSSIFPRRAPEASSTSRESATWGSDVELEEMESEQRGLAFSSVIQFIQFIIMQLTSSKKDQNVINAP